MGIQISGGGPEHIYESETVNGGIEAILGPREEVVRCRDCKYCDKNFWECNRLYVDITPLGFRMRLKVSSKCFCWWGERR